MPNRLFNIPLFGVFIGAGLLLGIGAGFWLGSQEKSIPPSSPAPPSFMPPVQPEKIPPSYEPLRVALTFDDGPHPEWTPQILSILASYHVPATFFAIGQNVELLAHNSPSSLQAIVEQTLVGGHKVGNHTYTHAMLNTLWAKHGWAGIYKELDPTQTQIQQVYGKTATSYFRPPYGYLPIHRRRGAEELFHTRGLTSVLWTIDTLDYRKETSIKEMLRHVSVGIHGEHDAVILMHDGGGNRRKTVRALPAIIRLLQRRGFVVVPLSEIRSSGPYGVLRRADIPLSR